MSRRNFIAVLVKSLSILALWLGLGATPACWAQGPENGLARALKAQARNTKVLLAQKGVVGTAVGLDGQGQPAVKVYVAAPQDAAGIARKLDGVPVDVQVTGVLFALAPPPGKGPGGGGGSIDPTARFVRPVPIGVSTGHPAITAGTIGCRVRSQDPGTGEVTYFALSNNHVYANQNDASLGDPVLQPGAFDEGTLPEDEIGMLADFEPIVFGGEANFIDAAIAFTTTNLVGNATPSNGYGRPKSTTIAPEDSLGLKVLKYGRTTGQTEGRIDGINATVQIAYGEGTALFVNQLVISPGGFSAGGDSGSLIVIKDQKARKAGPDHLKPVGLLFAGSAFVTIANPIDEVLDTLGVTIDGD